MHGVSTPTFYPNFMADHYPIRSIFSKVLPILIVSLTWLLSCQHPFFWDTVQLASRQAQWYYDQQFQQFLLPDEIDSGHPSGFGMYLAGFWLFFGQTLLVSHLAILPFLILILVGIFRLSKILNNYWSRFFPLLVVLDPVFLGQISLVSPDLALMACFIWGLIGVLEKRQLVLTFCAILLACISLRGMMAVMVLYLFQVFNDESQTWRKPAHWLRHMGPFVPAGILATLFLVYHSWAKSWVGFHTDSPWRESFNMVGLNGIIKNTLVLSWRILDYGRIFVLLILGFLLLRRGTNARTRPFVVLTILCLLVQLPHFLLFQGVNAHRYLLPFFLASNLLFFSVLQNSHLLPLSKQRLLRIAMIGLFSGNLWLYPQHIAQGWDSTPRHWPHFALRQQVIHYLDEHQIPLQSVGTSFPEIGPLHWRDLSGRQDGFSPLNLQQNEYVYYSSLMNDFSDKEREELFNTWQKVLILKKVGLSSILFKKP